MFSLNLVQYKLFTVEAIHSYYVNISGKIKVPLVGDQGSGFYYAGALLKQLRG